VDHYGHGRSDGIHALVHSVDELVEDLKYHIALLKSRSEFNKLPFFIMGISLGGMITLKYSLRCKRIPSLACVCAEMICIDPSDIKGMILMCPLVKVASHSLPHPLIHAIGRILQ
jgi:alpha-beta hydrolase superfamily lysophospholipase